MTSLRQALSSRALQIGLVLIAATWVLLAVLDAAGGPSEIHQRMGLWSIGVLVPIQAAVAITPFPSEAIALANSAVLGFWIGFACNWSGWMLMALIQHPLGRRAAVDFDFDASYARLPRWIRRFPVEHPVYLIFGRYLPWGNHLTNLSAGALGVPLTRLLWCTALREIPVSLLFAAAGTGMVALWR